MLTLFLLIKPEDQHFITELLSTFRFKKLDGTYSADLFLAKYIAGASLVQPCRSGRRAATVLRIILLTLD